MHLSERLQGTKLLRLVFGHHQCRGGKIGPEAAARALSGAQAQTVFAARESGGQPRTKRPEIAPQSHPPAAGRGGRVRHLGSALPSARFVASLGWYDAAYYRPHHHAAHVPQLGHQSNPIRPPLAEFSPNVEERNAITHMRLGYLPV